MDIAKPANSKQHRPANCRAYRPRRKRRAAAGLTGLFAVVGLASGAGANDTAAELAIGGLQFTKTSAVAMESEQLSISLDRVDVRYKFRNVTAAPVDLTVAFPLPVIDLAEGESISFSSNDPLNFVDFQTKVDGAPVKFTIDQRALVGDKDVTSILQDNKIAVLPIGDRQLRVADLAAPLRAQLVDAGMLTAAGTSERGKPLYEPGWSVKTSVVRQEAFPIARTVSVDHSYRPSIGGSGDTILRKALRQNKAMAKEIERYRRDYCVTDAFLAELDKIAGAGEANKAKVQERRINYVLKTGANWAGPIKDFRLTVSGGGRLVSFCTNGLEATGTDGSTFVAKDFVPQRDLKVLFVGRF